MTTPSFRFSRRDGACRSGTSRAAARLALTALIMAPFGAAGTCEAAERTVAPRGRIVDPAVVPAGAMSCTTCGGHAGGLHGHHDGCRDGHCAPHCPVRPDRYGYYGTQWRRWPGQQVVQVSNEQAATPAAPPRSEVPGPDEESMGPRIDELPVPPADAPAPLTPQAPDLLPPRPLDQQPMPEPRQPEPAPRRQPEPVPPADPAPAQPAPAQPAVKPEVKPEPTTAPTRPEDENLFEADSGVESEAEVCRQPAGCRGEARRADHSRGIQARPPGAVRRGRRGPPSAGCRREMRWAAAPARSRPGRISMREAGVEPARLAALEPKSSASASFATLACRRAPGGSKE